MARSLKKIDFIPPIGRAVLSCALLISSVNAAEVFVDPTRPPAAFIQGGQPGADVSLPVLQSVLLSSKHSVATISGQVVRLGEKFGDATVVRIAENEVVLRSGKNVQTLTLFPVIQKRKNVEMPHFKPEKNDR